MSQPKPTTGEWTAKDFELLCASDAELRARQVNAALDAERENLAESISNMTAPKLLELLQYPSRQYALDGYVAAAQQPLVVVEIQQLREQLELEKRQCAFESEHRERYRKRVGELTNQLAAAQAAIVQAIDILSMQDNAGKGRPPSEVTRRNQQAIDTLRATDTTALDAAIEKADANGYREGYNAAQSVAAAAQQPLVDMPQHILDNAKVKERKDS